VPAMRQVKSVNKKRAQASSNDLAEGRRGT
jgi:hypothetical protein